MEIKKYYTDFKKYRNRIYNRKEFFIVTDMQEIDLIRYYIYELIMLKDI